ncbi:MAG: hypothetical protein ACTTJC_06805 [Campylobacter sp.]
MYAGKTNIIANKDGVGVNNAGVMAANEISINSNNLRKQPKFKREHYKQRLIKYLGW